MQIACPECSMQYVLDPRLLPAGGASVQCTRCGHVFKASPQGTVSSPQPAPATTGERAAAGGSRSAMRSTQIFGGSPSGEHATVQPGSAPSSRVSASTQAYGAATAIPPVVPPEAPAQPSLGRSQIFGAVPGNATQSFGSVPPVEVPGGMTKKFGAVPPSAVTPGQSTQAFGAVPPVGAHPGGATQAFGAVPPVAPGNATQAFGAVPPVAPLTGQGTQAFGAVPPSSSGRTPAGGSTQVFGAVAPELRGTQNATHVFGEGSSQAPFEMAPPGPPEPSRPTRAFGVVPPPTPETQELSPIFRTAAFGAPVEAPAQDANRWPTPPPGASPPGSETLIPMGSPSGSYPFREVGSLSGSRRAPVELPPDLLSASRSPRGPEASSAPGGGGLRDRLLVGLAVVVGLVLTGVLAYPAWRDRDKGMPALAEETHEQAAAQLRRDDSASRDEAVRTLRSLVSTHPKFVEGQAELAVALSLRLDDVQAEGENLRLRAERLKRQLSITRQARATVDWEVRANALQAELDGINQESAPLRTRVETVRKDLVPLMEALTNAPEVEPATAVAARVRAKAFYAAVTGAADALPLAERLRNVEGTPKVWSILSQAEYALNSGSPPDSLEAVSSELANLRRDDKTLIRAYILGARLSLRLKNPAQAKTLLDEALAFNPNHALARKLLAEATEAVASP